VKESIWYIISFFIIVSSLQMVFCHYAQRQSV
jgi:hypothetical protein